jgi:DNA polymerase II small subunit/DNA polymerase delta subunit B
MFEIGFHADGEYVQIIEETKPEVIEEKVIEDTQDKEDKKLIVELKKQSAALHKEVAKNAKCEANYTSYKKTVTSRLDKFKGKSGDIFKGLYQ